MKDVLGFCDVPLLEGRVVAAVVMSTVSVLLRVHRTYCPPQLLSIARTDHRSYCPPHFLNTALTVQCTY